MNEALNFSTDKNSAEANRPRKLEEVQISFVFAPHENQEDLNLFSQKVKEADIVVLEGPGALDEEEIWNLISRGEISESHLETIFNNDNLNSWQKMMVKCLYKSNKEVYVVDLQDSDQEKKVSELENSFDNLKGEAIDLFFNGQFDEALEKMKEYIKLYSEIHSYRESIIIEKLKKLIFTNNGSGKAKKILALYGSTHTTLAHKLRKETTLSVKFEMNSPVNVFYSEGLLIRAEEFKKNSMLADKQIPEGKINYLLVSSIIEQLCSIYISEYNKKLSNEQVVWLAKKIVGGLTYEDFRLLSSKFKGVVDSEVPKVFNGFLNERGISIPSTEDEIKRVMGKDWDLFNRNKKVDNSMV